jgi:hypothetical protein
MTTTGVIVMGTIITMAIAIATMALTTNIMGTAIAIATMALTTTIPTATAIIMVVVTTTIITIRLGSCYSGGAGLISQGASAFASTSNVYLVNAGAQTCAFEGRPWNS